MTFRKHFQDLLCGAVRLTLFPAAVRFGVRGRPTIVNYHNPSPEVFERHIRAFRRHYAFVSLDRVVTAIVSGSVADLPRHSMVITIDDGYEGNVRLTPTIEKYGVSGTIYVNAGLISSRRRFWWSAVPDHDQRERLKRLPDADRRKVLREVYSHDDEREYVSGDVLSATSLTRLLSSGVTIGSHTAFHPILPNCSTEVALRELQESKHILGALTGRVVEHFAYPGGALNHAVRQLVSACGYISARTIDPGWVTRRSDPLALPCFGISDDASVAKALVQASGVWAYAKRFVAGIHREQLNIGTAALDVATLGPSKLVEEESRQ